VALFTENETPQLVSQLLNLFGVVRMAEALGEFKECLFFQFASFESSGAEAAFLAT